MSPVSKDVVVTLGDQESRPRPRRADARRNYEQLLEQARMAFAEFGVDASLDEIARRAGVASGTLYRHFPTRQDLIEAVLAEQIAELVDLGRGQLAAEDEFDALFTWLRATLTHALTYRGLAAAVMNSALDNGLVSAWHAEMFDVGTALLARARQSGVIVAVADDVDVLKMVGAIAWAAQDSSVQADRMLALLMNGLRYGGPAERRCSFAYAHPSDSVFGCPMGGLSSCDEIEVLASDTNGLQPAAMENRFLHRRTPPETGR